MTTHLLPGDRYVHDAARALIDHTPLRDLVTVANDCVKTTRDMRTWSDGEVLLWEALCSLTSRSGQVSLFELTGGLDDDSLKAVRLAIGVLFGKGWQMSEATR